MKANMLSTIKVHVYITHVFECGSKSRVWKWI